MMMALSAVRAKKFQHLQTRNLFLFFFLCILGSLFPCVVAFYNLSFPFSKEIRMHKRTQALCGVHKSTYKQFAISFIPFLVGASG